MPSRPKPKTCSACRSVKEPFIGHDIYNCPNIAAADRADLLKSFSLEVDDECYDEQDSADEKEQHNAIVKVTEDGFSSVHVQRVGIVESPHFKIRIKKTMLTMVLDTGATGSMISLDLCKLANLDVYPTTQRAILTDGDSHLTVVGEVHTTITMNSNVMLPLGALVVTKRKAGLIVGMVFMKQNNVVIDIPNNALLVRGNTFPFNKQPGNPKVSLLRAEVNRDVLPGDNFILPVPPNFLEDQHVAVEPREQNFSWLEPIVSWLEPIVSWLEPIVSWLEPIVSWLEPIVSWFEAIVS